MLHVALYNDVQTFKGVM